MPRQLIEKSVKSFGKGTVNFVESEIIDNSAASSSSNFITDLDKIILTYGRRRIGNEYAGSSPVLGLHSIKKVDGTDMIFRKILTNLQYYSPSTDMWVDIKTDLANSTSPLYFDNSYTPAGRQVWACGLDGLFKIYPSNPTSLLTLTNSAKNFKGKILIEKSRMLCWDVANDPTGLKLSKVDRDQNYKTPNVIITATDTAGEVLTHSQVTLSSADANTDVLTHSGEISIQTGDLIIFQNSGGAVPGGLTAGTQYYAIRISATTIRAAASLDLANNNVWIDITSAGSGTNTIRIGLVDIQTKDKVVITSTATMPGGVTSGATYWAIRVSATQIKLAISYANAVAGTAVDITSAGTGTVTCNVVADFVGASGSTTYSGTLKKGQVFGLMFTAGAQIAIDDKNGALGGQVGTTASGTINYATGAFSVTFGTTTTAECYVSYLYEDPTNGGLADFTYSATRLAGEGVIMRQDASGTRNLSVLPFDNKYYSIQDKGSFRLTIDPTDTVFTNEIFNLNVAAAAERAVIAVSDGIVFVDVSDPAKPKLRKLSYDQLGDKVLPFDLSVNFKMDGFYFDKAAMIQFGNYIVFSCRTTDSSINNRCVFYHILNKSFDVMLNGYNMFTIANNKLYGGDSSSPNVYELVSGFDDLDFTINAEWIGKNDDMDTEQLKKLKQLFVEGYIAKNQSYDVYLSYDKDAFTKVGSISGSGSYVQSANAVTVGSALYASQDYGGEGDGTVAFYYKHRFKIQTPKFSRLRIKFVPTGIGYLSITEFKYSDIRLKGFKTLKKYK